MTEERDNQTEEAGILKEFAYHKPSEEGLKKITVVRETYSLLLTTLKQASSPNRELSIAITNLETSAMWAIKAIIFNDSAYEVE